MDKRRPRPLPALSDCGGDLSDCGPEYAYAFEIYVQVVRYWVPALRADEARALLFILDRTWGCLEASAAIPAHEFVRGFYYEEDETYRETYGSGISTEGAVRTAIQSLERLGIVAVWRGPGEANVYSINTAWDPTNLLRIKQSR